MASRPPVLAPVIAEDRLEHIDLVRGYALLGVLLVNLHSWFRGPFRRYPPGANPYPELWNVAANHVTQVWFSGKSVTLFSMLFAIGLCIQRERTDAKGVPWTTYAFRRLGTMLLFGALHIVFIWNGDVLHDYALLGLLLLFFLGRERRTVGFWLGGIVGAGLLYQLGQWGWDLIRQTPAPPLVSPRLKEFLEWAEACARGYAQTSWFAVLRFRLLDYAKIMAPPRMIGFWSFTFMNFLGGLYLWKHGAVRTPREHLPLLRRVAGWGLGIGLLANILTDVFPPLRPFLYAHWSWGRLFMPLIILAQGLGTQILALGIGATLLVLWQDPTWKERLRPLTYVGRMAFTNYITQSIVCTTLFYGFGLGLYDKLGPMAGLGIVAVIYGLQIPLSRWWLSRFRYGPLEWLWRTLTYGSIQPFRRRAPVAVAIESLAP
jgi:uncharacterized protein